MKYIGCRLISGYGCCAREVHAGDNSKKGTYNIVIFREGWDYLSYLYCAFHLG